jgi:SAM-dependent methyltransferase
MYTERLAAIYDALHDYKDYAREARYALSAIRQLGVSGGALLETACGTGRFLEHLRVEFAVEGLDLSAALLARAALRVPGVALHQGDMADFALPSYYDVVCCLFRSIAYVRTADRFRRSIQCMAGHLRSGGLLVIEPFFTPESFQSGKVALNEYRDHNMKASWMYLSERSDRIGSFDNHYVVGTVTGIEHFTERHELGLFTHEDYESAFAAAGLVITYDPVGPTGIGLYIGKKTSPGT